MDRLRQVRVLGAVDQVVQYDARVVEEEDDKVLELDGDTVLVEDLVDGGQRGHRHRHGDATAARGLARGRRQAARLRPHGHEAEDELHQVRRDVRRQRDPREDLRQALERRARHRLQFGVEAAAAAAFAPRSRREMATATGMTAGQYLDTSQLAVIQLLPGFTGFLTNETPGNINTWQHLAFRSKNSDSF